MKRKFGMGMLGFAILLIVIAIILMLQQYVRHGVISLLGATFDIKQYAAILIAIRCFLIYRKWNRPEAKE